MQERERQIRNLASFYNTPFLKRTLLTQPQGPVCDKYNFQATYTNIFGLTFFGEYEYKYINVDIFWPIRIFLDPIF